MHVVVMGLKPRAVQLSEWEATVARALTHRWQSGAEIGRAIGATSRPGAHLGILAAAGIVEQKAAPQGQGTIALYRLRWRAIRWDREHPE